MQTKEPIKVGKNCMSRTGILFILVGPSAAGKNTLMKRVQKQLGDLPQLATKTTRAIRNGELQGQEHDFVTIEQFGILRDSGALIEYTPVHMGDWYGTPRQDVEEALLAGRDLIADIECLGAEQVHDAYPDNVVLIFLSPSRLDTLAERIQQRGGLTREAIADRLERAKFEMTFAARCHYLILNDIVEPAVEHLRQIIMSERVRRRREPGDAHPLLVKPVFHSAAIGLIQYENQLLTHANTIGYELPTFPIEDYTRLPHDALQDVLQATFGFAVSIEAVSDRRFDFTAPHYVTMAVLPQDVYLYFYYRCRSPRGLLSVPGWSWQAVDDLYLPSAIRKLLTR